MNDIPPISRGRMFWVWSEEIPWLYGQIRDNDEYSPLMPWAKRALSYFTGHCYDRYEWGTSEPNPLIPLFEQLLADLEEGRVDRADGKRILPKWRDSKTGREWYAPKATTEQST